MNALEHLKQLTDHREGRRAFLRKSDLSPWRVVILDCRHREAKVCMQPTPETGEDLWLSPEQVLEQFVVGSGVHPR